MAALIVSEHVVISLERLRDSAKVERKTHDPVEKNELRFRSIARNRVMEVREP